MPDNDKTIYKTCREAAGYTQERAAELLNLSVRQLARFEAGELIPGDDIAYSMVVLYDSQYLAVQHLRSASHLAAAILPPVEQTTLQAATIRLFNSFSRWADKRRDRQLLDIAEDGIIDEEERPMFDEIVRELGGLVKDFYELQLASADAERSE